MVALLHIAAPDVCDGTSAIGESRPHFKAHPFVKIRLNLCLGKGKRDAKV